MIRKILLKKIWRLSFPVLLANLLQISVTVIDTYMVGDLGPISIAAIGMGNTIRLLLLITVLSISSGAISLIAQAKGSRDPKRMSFVTRQSLISGILLSIVLIIVGLSLSNPLLHFMNNGGEKEAVFLGTKYLQVIFLGCPFLILHIVVNRLMQGAGDTFTPLLLTGGMVIINIILNYLFIFGCGFIPAMGIVGAALGTVFARMISVSIALIIFNSGKNVIKLLPGSWLPNKALIKDILAIGLPSGIQGIFRHGSNIVIMGLVTATELGTYGAAVLTIGIQVESLAVAPVVGMNIASTSLVGQEIGKWQTKEAYHKGNIMIILGVFVMTILIIPMVVFAPQIIHAFDPSAHPAVLAGGLAYFRINTLFLPISGLAIMITGTLRGAGDTKPAMISTLIGRNLLTIGLACLFVFYLDYGSFGVWYAIVIGRVFDGIYLWIVWLGRKWMRVALEKTEIFRVHLENLKEEKIQSFLREIRTPLMALPKTVELVTPNSVIYRQMHRKTVVNFKGGNYQIESS